MEHQVFEHKLKGGARGLVVHVPGNTVVNLVIRFNSGYQFGDAGHYEVPHVLEHVIPAGAKTHFPNHSGLFIDLEKNGAYLNAQTSWSFNQYIFEFADFELDRMIDLQREYFLENLFRADDVKTELSNVHQELSRCLGQHNIVCTDIFNRAANPKQARTYEKSLAQLGSIKVDHLTAYFKASHTLANARFYISGDFKDGGKAVMARLSKSLEGLPKGRRWLPDYSPEQSFAPVFVRHEIKQIYYRFGWVTDPLAEQLWPASAVLSELLTGGFNSRVYGKARKLGLAYSLSGGSNWDPGSSNLSYRGYVTPDNAKKLFELFTKETISVIEGNVTDEEVEAAKDVLIGSRIRAYQTGGQLLSWYSSHYEERDVVEDWAGWNDKLRAVTREQVIEVARHVTTGANRGSAFVGPVTEAQAQRFAKILDPIGS